MINRLIGNFCKRSIKIYTKTGDKGRSSLYTGERRSKDNQIFHALGNTDELNAHIGMAATACNNQSDILAMLTSIQSRLLDLGGCIATPKTSENQEKVNKMQFNPNHTQQLEQWIDGLQENLPQLKCFILPSGGEASSRLHVARAVCRRAERSLVPLLESGELDENAYMFMNRLSDFLFVLARTAAHREGIEEIKYKKEP
ncbi:MMAB_2 [Blepharisma stoltei]|uniref:Corrinoid adenosyltransferase MMAB n=1 Tax=Blepharisma stoltei TaxID=1481888 RepID=A0AAU9JZL1_9CILI|nr:unnamed protein product [Blepharisma stoltei]